MTFKNELQNLADSSKYVEVGLDRLKDLLREKASSGIRGGVNIEEGTLNKCILAEGAPQIVVDEVLARLSVEGVNHIWHYGDWSGDHNYVEFTWA